MALDKETIIDTINKVRKNDEYLEYSLGEEDVALYQAIYELGVKAERERAAKLSPNGMNILASDAPHVVFAKYAEAIRKG